MRAAFVGGLDRLKREYEKAAEQLGFTLKVFSGKESCLVGKIGNPDLLIVLTRMVSHSAKSEVLNHSRSLGTPVLFLHTNGIGGLRRSLRRITRGHCSERFFSETATFCAGNSPQDPAPALPRGRATGY
ncbi:MAG: DUF2325 domain-containing protein [Desulfovibrio sp.]|nr:DUF2325 domain-containing protein [Desulfovibrio sp.]